MKAIPKGSGFLISIKRGNIPVMPDESIQLTFAPGNWTDASKKRIHPEVPAFLDVFWISELGQIELCPVNRELPNSVAMKEIFKQRGTYVLNVIVSGKNVTSVAATLIFDWTGDWQTATLKKA
jgi:hypothetical protein